MLRDYVKVFLFASSYIPLYIIFVLLNYSNLFVDAFFLVLSVAVVIMLQVIFSQSRSISPEIIRLVEVENINRMNLEYLVVYILPFLGLDFAALNMDAAILFLFVVMGLMYVRSNSIYLNPTLTLIGLNIFKVKTAENEDAVIITRKKLKSDENGEVVQLTEGVFFGR